MPPPVPPTRTNIDGEIRERLARQGAAVVVVPFDPHLVGDRALQLGRLKARTATALIDLARVIMNED